MNYKLPNKNDTDLGVYIVAIIFVLALAFGISCLYAWVGMLLWNWIIVGELSLFTKEIGFWHMWGIVELCSILFKTHNYNSNN